VLIGLRWEIKTEEKRMVIAVGVWEIRKKGELQSRDRQPC
jgi:hypothetical protein